jgi:hypothetical protein
MKTESTSSAEKKNKKKHDQTSLEIWMRGFESWGPR